MTQERSRWTVPGSRAFRRCHVFLAYTASTFGIDDTGTRTLYIGESEDLRNRASQYRNAKKDGGRNRTSRRIHKEVVAHLSVGRVISFAITTEAHIGGDVAADLRLKSARRLAENAAVLRAQTTPDVRVLNIDADLGNNGEPPEE